MTDVNPDHLPKSAIDAQVAIDREVEQIAVGKMLNSWAILIQLLATNVGFVFELLDLIGLFSSGILGIMGILSIRRLAKGMGYSPVKQRWLFILMLIPVANLLTLAILNIGAIERLREAGYQVRWLRVSKPQRNEANRLQTR